MEEEDDDDDDDGKLSLTLLRLKLVYTVYKFSHLVSQNAEFFPFETSVGQTCLRKLWVFFVRILQSTKQHRVNKLQIL